jgi:hypothetical protein
VQEVCKSGHIGSSLQVKDDAVLSKKSSTSGLFPTIFTPAFGRITAKYAPFHHSQKKNRPGKWG